MSEAIYSADPYQEFALAEAARESRRAQQLSRAEGRAVDSFGFAIAAPNSNAATALPTITGDPFTTADKLKIERWRKEAREAAKLRHECERRQLCEAFQVPSAGELLMATELFPEMAAMVRR